MTRLQFPNVGNDGSGAARVAAAVSQQRQGSLPNLYRMLLHTPDIAAGWLALGTAVRYRSSLDDLLRELVICAVARVCGSDYEWAHHAPLARRYGASDEQLDRLPADGDDTEGVFTPAQAAAVRYVAAVARLGVDDGRFGSVGEHFDDTQVVELTATAAYYAGVARFLAALQVDIDEDLG